MKYIDRYGRYHDRPVENGEPSSDNGWLYTAVAKRLGAEVNLSPNAAQYCAENLERHPLTVTNRPYVPFSRDEVLGLAYLGYLKPEHLDGWNFSPYPLPKFNPIKLVQQLWRVRKEHRTFFWRNGLTQIYHVAFMVPLQDRHFLNQCWGRYNAFYHLIHIIDTMLPKDNRSARNMRFLKSGKDRAGVANYFGPEHPLSELANAKK